MCWADAYSLGEKKSFLPFLLLIPFIKRSNSSSVLFSGTAEGKNFQKVIILQYPRVGVWTLAFRPPANLLDANQRSKYFHVSCSLQQPIPHPASYIDGFPQEGENNGSTGKLDCWKARGSTKWVPFPRRESIGRPILEQMDVCLNFSLT